MDIGHDMPWWPRFVPATGGSCHGSLQGYPLLRHGATGCHGVWTLRRDATGCRDVHSHTFARVHPALNILNNNNFGFAHTRASNDGKHEVDSPGGTKQRATIR
jgi:hypothetical protein